MKYWLFLLCWSLTAQVAEKANKDYQTPEGRAAVASGIGAADRDARQKPKELVASMELKPGMVVGDMGTGVGYMLPYLSAAVGANGRVIAEDIFADFLEKAKQKAASAKLVNVEFILGSTDDPKFAETSLDAILMLDVYHHLDYPEKVLAKLRTALKPDGRLIVVEYHRNKVSLGNGRA